MADRVTRPQLPTHLGSRTRLLSYYQ